MRAKRRTRLPCIEAAVSPEAILERLQSFLKWNAHRTDALDVSHEPVANPACYTRGKGDKLEHWITAEVWRTELFPDDEAGDAPKALASLGLLRLPKEPANFQICVRLRHDIVKVYAVLAGIWTAKRNVSNGTTQLAFPSDLKLNPSLTPDGGPLSGLLEQAARSALQKGLELLSISADPADRNFAAILRSQVAMAGHVLGVQLRVDEHKLREANRKDAIALALAELRAWRPD
jgi:hypothetical protein